VVREEHEALAAKPFANLSDETLLAYGTPQTWLEPIRAATEDAFLAEIFDALPDESREYLMAVANGDVPPAPPQRTRDPFAHPDAKRRFSVAESEEELKRALTLPWQKWMVYLHPSQREAVDRDFAGPARVTGGPGTGKSVVAVHRAARLARAGRGRVLLTSFSKTLAAQLARQLDELMMDEPEHTCVEVVNLHQVAVERLAQALGVQPKAADNKTVGGAAKHAALGAKDSLITPALVEAEWDMVIDPYGIETWEEYAGVDRHARGTPLNRSQRELLWPAIEAMRKNLEDLGLTTWSRICWDLVALLDESEVRPYAHVVADEAQDFGPAELRLLRALVESGPNDVFLASDANQRIFKPHTPVAKAGLEVRGRSTALRVNYRTTEQIRRRADRIVAGIVQGDEATPVAVSLLAGTEPEFKVLPTVKVEMQEVADWLKRLVANGYRPGEIAIFARTKDILRDRVHPAVKLANLESYNLESDDPAPSNRVAMGTVHRSKGLQFRAVAVMAVEDGVLPMRSVRSRQPDEAAERAFVEKERNLLYVACSRARERLLVTGAGKVSELFVGDGRVRESLVGA